MQISILTLFPEMFSGPFAYSIVERAQGKKLVAINLVNLRDFATDRYKTVDDRPYGGGVGMILRVDLVDKAIQSSKFKVQSSKQRTILLDPQGTPYTQAKAQELSQLNHLILICGHYEGVDERIRSLVDEEISIGDYIVTGGELPAMTVTDSVIRLLPGVLTKPEATANESFTRGGLLEYPQYTRPPNYKGMKVPPILLSGDHGQIARWREKQARRRTQIRRPELVETKGISRSKGITFTTTGHRRKQSST